MQEIKKNLEAQTKTILAEQRRWAFGAFLTVAITIPLLLFAWFVTYKNFKMYIAKRKQAIQARHEVRTLGARRLRFVELCLVTTGFLSQHHLPDLHMLALMHTDFDDGFGGFRDKLDAVPLKRPHDRHVIAVLVAPG